MKKFLKLTICFLIIATASSCKKKEETPTSESAYIKAYELLKDKSYSESAKAFEKIEDDFPFSKWAAKAQTMAAYAFYKNKDYADVIRTVDDFIRVNPANSAISYMMYMKALSYYDQIPEINRAQDNTKLAYVTFRELLTRFPGSDYAQDAEDRVVFINEHIAGARMSVGRYQISQKNYVGAIKSFQEVVKRYSFTDQAPEALHRLVELYLKIGLKTEAQKTYTQLQERFPNNEWAKTAEKIDLK